MVAALYIDAKGPYPRLLGASACWDKDRDARTFAGSDPVVVHPPCQKWGPLVRVNARRWGTRIGDDDGMFRHALGCVCVFGGVLEHPARSIAFPAHGLPSPRHGSWQQFAQRAWVCEVWQSAYGHPAEKRTWLLYVGNRPPFDLRWERRPGTHTIGGGVNTGYNRKPRASKSQSILTPTEFAIELINLAHWSRNTP